MTTTTPRYTAPMPAHRCPRCLSDDVRATRTGVADGYLYEMICQVCSLWEDHRSDEADFARWWQRWSAPAGAGPASARPTQPAPAPAPPPRPVAAVDDDPLLAAVTAAPDDDAPRLAYADAIAAHRAERAELIRLQIARARAERARGDIEGAPSAREGALLRARAAEWARFLDPFVRPTTRPRPDPGWRFERGFVEFVRVDPSTLLDVGARLFAMAPIRHLDVVADQPVRPVLDSPLLGRLRSLGLPFAGVDDDGAAALAANPHLTGLTWLDLRDNRIGERGVRALAASPVIRAIPIVLLAGNPADPAQQYSLDGDGSVADSWTPPLGAALAEAHGPIPWLTLPTYARQPDRFHARR